MANLPITPGSGASARTVELSTDVHAQVVFQAEMYPDALSLASASSHSATVDDSVDSLPNIPATATHALLSIEGASLRWLDTGTNPTATLGHRLVADNYFWISGRQRLLDWRMIRDTGVSATIMVTYYQYSDA